MAQQKSKVEYKYIVGVDEAGRGPLAGPVAVGVVVMPGSFDLESKLPGIRDSKKLSEAAREKIFKEAQYLQKAGELRYAAVLVSASVIDKKGIVPAIKLAMAHAFKQLELQPDEVFIKLDGSLLAPSEYAQETIIKGDDKELIIGLASIMAKVTRDRYMERRASLAAFTPYDFAQHKGYGTKAHRAAIAQHGLSTEHRSSYCKNIKIR